MYTNYIPFVYLPNILINIKCLCINTQQDYIVNFEKNIQFAMIVDIFTVSI